MNEHFYMEIYLWIPHRRNAQHFGGGSETVTIIFIFHATTFLFYTLISRTVNFRRTFQSAPVTRKIIRNPPAGNTFLTILFKGDFQMNQTTELVRRAASGDAHAFCHA